VKCIKLLHYQNYRHNQIVKLFNSSYFITIAQQSVFLIFFSSFQEKYFKVKYLHKTREHAVMTHTNTAVCETFLLSAFFLSSLIHQLPPSTHRNFVYRCGVWRDGTKNVRLLIFFSFISYF
jgi:hypothetical protein